MVMDIVHKIKYVIEFKQPVDYFNVILQKQIDLRQKFSGNENNIIILELDSSHKRLTETNFYSKFGKIFSNHNYFGRKSYLDLSNDSNKYVTFKDFYKDATERSKYMLLPEYFLDLDETVILKKIVSYEEYEYKVDLLLEEFTLFCNTFEFNLDERKIIDSIILDPNLKSNIKFCGWKDYWETI